MVAFLRQATDNDGRTSPGVLSIPISRKLQRTLIKQKTKEENQETDGWHITESSWGWYSNKRIGCMLLNISWDTRHWKPAAGRIWCSEKTNKQPNKQTNKQANIEKSTPPLPLIMSEDVHSNAGHAKMIAFKQTWKLCAAFGAVSLTHLHVSEIRTFFRLPSY